MPVTHTFNGSALSVVSTKETLQPLVCPAVGFQNGWVNFDTASQMPLAFTFIGGTVFFSGRMKNPTVTDNNTNTIVLIPNGYDADRSGGGAAGYLNGSFQVELANFGINDAGVNRHYITIYRNAAGACSILDVSGSYRANTRASGIYYKDFPSVSDKVTVTLPNGKDQSQPLKVCFFFHGAGDNYLSYFSGSATDQFATSKLFRSTFNALLDDGWAIVSSNGGAITNHWGNPQSDTATTAVIAWLKANFNISKLAAVGQSMGGLSSLRAVTKNPEITNWYGIYPVCNIDNMLSNPGYQGSVLTAYGNQAGYDAVKTSTNPVLMTPSLFTGKKLRSIASYGETVVPRAQHSDLLKSYLASIVTMQVDTHTGDHGDATAFVPQDVVNHLNS